MSGKSVCVSPTVPKKFVSNVSRRTAGETLLELLPSKKFSLETPELFTKMSNFPNSFQRNPQEMGQCMLDSML